MKAEGENTSRAELILADVTGGRHILQRKILVGLNHPKAEAKAGVPRTLSVLVHCRMGDCREKTGSKKKVRNYGTQPPPYR